MTELEILKETWRMHFFDLIRNGEKVEADVAVFEADDEEFEQYVKSLEENTDEDDWEPVK